MEWLLAYFIIGLLLAVPLFGGRSVQIANAEIRQNNKENVEIIIVFSYMITMILAWPIRVIYKIRGID